MLITADTNRAEKLSYLGILFRPKRWGLGMSTILAIIFSGMIMFLSANAFAEMARRAPMYHTRPASQGHNVNKANVTGNTGRPLITSTVRPGGGIGSPASPMARGR